MGAPSPHSSVVLARANRVRAVARRMFGRSAHLIDSSSTKLSACERFSGIGPDAEQRLRADLKAAREAAESDETNLERLKSFFLDCLVRAGVPGITLNDRVQIPTTSFYPEVYGPDPNDQAVTTFALVAVTALALWLLR
jgi:hypothetical protein